jgi:hypothetical protein
MTLLILPLMGKASELYEVEGEMEGESAKVEGVAASGAKFA